MRLCLATESVMKEKLSHIGETARSLGYPQQKSDVKVNKTEQEERLVADVSSQEAPCWRK